MSEIPSLIKGAPRRSLTIWRPGAWGLTVGGFWLFWAYRCYKTHDGMHLEHLIRNIAWGGIPTLFLAIVLPIAMRRFDAAESPDEPKSKKWIRLLICLCWAGIVAFAIFGLISCIFFVQFMLMPWGSPG
jgi:hypothetical protein